MISHKCEKQGCKLCNEENKVNILHKNCIDKDKLIKEIGTMQNDKDIEGTEIDLALDILKQKIYKGEIE